MPALGHRDSVRRIRLALAALGLVLVAGTLGYVVLGFGVLDALYQTVTTVGSGQFLANPTSDTRLEPRTILIALGTPAQLDSVRRHAGPH